MTSNLDILSFLKADQDDRAKERQKDKEIIAMERKEDMEHILGLLKIGIQKEVSSAMEIFEEKLMLQENVNKELHDKIDSLTRDTGIYSSRCTGFLPYVKFSVLFFRTSFPPKMCTKLKPN